MLADEVTHVKMGSDWLRRLTADDPERRARALEFQRVVDKLFSLGGARGEEEDSPIKLARRFRELAGFNTEEIDEIAELSTESRRELARYQEQAAAKPAAGAGRAGLTWPSPSRPRPSPWCCSTSRRSWPRSSGSPRRSAARPTPTSPIDGRRGRPAGPGRRRRRSTRIVLSIEGGAFEDPRHPRQLSEHAVTDTVGRLLLQAHDRRDPGLRRPARRRRHRRCPTGWPGTSTPSVGCSSSGYESQRQRRLYDFRNRHGFTDAADAAFDQLWTGSGLTWADITRALRRRRGRPAPPDRPTSATGRSAGCRPDLRAQLRSWALIASSRSICGGVRQQTVARPRHVDHVGRVEMGLLGRRASPTSR